MPKVAGILSVVSGALAIVGAVPLGWLVRGIVGFGTSGAVEIPIVAVAAPLLALGAIAVIGGMSSIRRRSWEWALAGSICAVIFPPLGLPAVVLVVLSRREFAK